MDKISVVVPVYNVEQYLRKCVDSLLNQTYSNLEIILVDDGSKDLSGAICDEYAQKDSRVQVVHKSNGGLSDARNVGLDIATGEYIGFVDSDDWVDSDMYNDLYNRISETQTNICVCGRYDFVGGKKLEGLCPVKPKVYSSKEFLKVLFKGKWWDVSSCDKLFKRYLFDDIRYPVGEINEDAAVIHKLVHKAERISTINKRYYNYNHRESSITTTVFSEKRLVDIKHAKEIVEYVEKEFPELLGDAKAFYGKRLIGLCVYVFPYAEYATLYKKLFSELTLKYRDLYFKDKIKYITMKCKIYYIIRDCVKKIMKKY